MTVRILFDSKAEIRAGVLAGNVVTAHEKPINFNGWVGEGYTIIDPQTGAGAYKIAGGGNGAVTDFVEGADKVMGVIGTIGIFLPYGKAAEDLITLITFAVKVTKIGLACETGWAAFYMPLVLAIVTMLFMLAAFILVGSPMSIISGYFLKTISGFLLDKLNTAFIEKLAKNNECG